MLFHLSRLRLRQRFTLERSEPCANAATRERRLSGATVATTPGQGLRIKPPASWQLFRRSQRCPWQESNPRGSVLRVGVICVATGIKQSYYNRDSESRCSAVGLVPVSSGLPVLIETRLTVLCFHCRMSTIQ